MRTLFKEMREILDERIVSKMKYKFLILFVVAALAALLYPPVVSAAPILGDDLASFAVLGASGVTNVATSTIGGNLGSAPNASVGGGYTFTSGSLQPNTALAQSAQLQLDAAILALNAFGVGTPITDGSLDTYQSNNGGFIGPGTYTVSAATVNLAGNLILNGGGSNTAVWVFQFPSTLITSTISNVTVTNVGDGSGVGLYWNVGSAATLNGPTFAGNVLASALISSDGNLTINCGRLLSADSQVTLIQDNISITGCAGGSCGYDQRGAAVVPIPAAVWLLGSGLIGLAGLRRKFKN
jgi:hypothetical protein